jgi:hypothetical protein
MVRGWNLATCRTLHLAQFHKMPMPETAVNKNASPVFPEYQIWMTRQPFMVKPVTKTSLPQSTPHNHFWLCILVVDCCHVFVTLLQREPIHAILGNPVIT